MEVTKLQPNLSTMAILETEESGRCVEVAIMGRVGVFFLGSTTCLFFSQVHAYTVSHNHRNRVI